MMPPVVESAEILHLNRPHAVANQVSSREPETPAQPAAPPDLQARLTPPPAAALRAAVEAGPLAGRGRPDAELGRARRFVPGSHSEVVCGRGHPDWVVRPRHAAAGWVAAHAAEVFAVVPDRVPGLGVFLPA